jgi:predicted nucleic acid-binding protein
MSDYLLDACALVNLYCGWGGLKELQDFGASWSIGDTALKEAMFVRDFDANGGIHKVTLDPAAVVANGNLQVLSLRDAGEHASLIEFAMELDDGEAQALSLALHRKRVLVTDDRPAVRVASAPHVVVQTMGMPEILMAWGNTNTECRRRLPEVVRRVSVLGAFQLKNNPPHYRWWQTLLTAP